MQTSSQQDYSYSIIAPEEEDFAVSQSMHQEIVNKSVLHNDEDFMQH